MNKTQAKKQADALFSKHIRSRGRCEAARYGSFACSPNLQCCHIRSRSYMAIRWADDNALAMCGAHHMYFTYKPLEWEQFCLETKGIDFNGLRLRGLNDPPMDPFDVIERLRGSA